MAEKKEYGHVTVGFETPTETKLEVMEFIQTIYNDNRKITISKLEDDTLFLTVENPKETQRAEQVMMRLSKESFVGLITTCLMYANSTGMDLQGELSKQMGDDKVQYSHSDNITIK